MAIRFRSKGWYAIVIALALLVWYYEPSLGWNSKDQTFRVSPGSHPISQLTARAERQWDDLLKKQSRSLSEAVKEYKRRYGRKPPKGFDHWYEWSVERGLKLVDAIHHNLEPFWGLTPTQIESRRMEMMETAQSDRLLNLEIRNGQVSDDPKGAASTARWPDNKHYYKLFEGIAQFLPDLDVIINLHDYPLIYISRDDRERLVSLGREGRFVSDVEHDMYHSENGLHEGDMNWRDLRRACPSDSAIHTQVTKDMFGEDTLEPTWEQQQLSYRLPSAQGGFMVNHSRSMDLCHNPEMLWQHGHFLDEFHPWLHVERNYLFPVFSWSVYPHSSDILIPTPYRFQDDKHELLPWEERVPQIGWSGTLSGISMNSATNFLSQRFRLARMLVEDQTTHPVLVTTTDTTGQERYETILSRAGPMNDAWMNINFVGSADEWDYSYVGNLSRATVRFGQWMEESTRNAHKMLLDVDGWGWSARFRSLLWTGSPVLKSTTFKEATSDWLIPWYHYIPMDYAYRDFYSIALYYLGIEGTSQTGHDAEMQEIGRHGQEWVEEHATWDHHVSYMYRLGLEWARVMSDDRASMDYKG